MKISPQGIELIREREGCELAAYLDTANPPVWTIGVGHTFGVKEGDTCTVEQADAWLRNDLGWVESVIHSYVTVPLEQYQYDALCSFVFNVGEPQFRASSLLRLINMGEPERAAAQFDRWHIPPSIIPRRNAEREQFKGAAFVARLA